MKKTLSVLSKVLLTVALVLMTFYWPEISRLKLILLMIHIKVSLRLSISYEDYTWTKRLLRE